MTSKKQRQAMQEYIVSRLEASNPHTEPRTKKIGRKNSSYVLVGEEAETAGIVLLIDQHYSRQDFLDLYRQAKQYKKDVAVVLIKDGTTFFRPAKHRGHKRRKPDRSLKKYSAQELQKLLMLHPIESFLAENRDSMQYYQPESERLEEGLECFQFKPVVFDYTGREEWYLPEERKSESLFLWTDRKHLEGDLVLEGDYLKDRKAVRG